MTGGESVGATPLLATEVAVIVGGRVNVARLVVVAVIVAGVSLASMPAMAVNAAGAVSVNDAGGS